MLLAFDVEGGRLIIYQVEVRGGSSETFWAGPTHHYYILVSRVWRAHWDDGPSRHPVPQRALEFLVHIPLYSWRLNSSISILSP